MKYKLKSTPLIGKYHSQILLFHKTAEKSEYQTVEGGGCWWLALCSLRLAVLVETFQWKLKLLHSARDQQAAGYGGR